MTKRNPVSSEQNIWYDAEQVDASDLTLEQDYNRAIQSAIINNNIGTGIVSDFLLPRVIFDTSLTTEILDGKPINSQNYPDLFVNNPSDNNYGNQLEIILTDSKAAGSRHIKICIMGLDFESKLQYETFVFKTNENQFTKKHYTSVLLVLLNDFSGIPSESFNLGGRILIKEADPYSVSRDTVMISQTLQPNLFFRDFYNPYYSSLENLLKAGLPYYDIATLISNINTGERDNKTLNTNDVTTKIGQKFLATTDNIQKVTLLLSAINPNSNLQDPNEQSIWYDWSGDIVVTIYPLQTTIQCPTDIPPGELIEYSPSPSPLAQISFSKSTLLSQGITLNNIPQPVDFVFSNTSIAKSGNIVEGQYYAVTINRSGSANTGVIYVATGNKYTSNSRMTIFNGNLWTDLTEEDLWFQICTDAAKVSDGQAYQSGNGLVLPKTIIDPDTNQTIDYCLDNLSFPGDRLATAALFGEIDKTAPTQDLRTGNLVYSRQKNVPKVELLDSALEVPQLQNTTDVLLLGDILDKNVKFYDSNTSTFTNKLYTNSIFGNEIFIDVTDDPDDLKGKLFDGDLVNAKIYPDNSNKNFYYRIAKAEQIESLLGDVNGDGVIDERDVELLKSYIGFNFDKTPPLNSSITVNPTNVVYENGYQTYKKDFVASFGISFCVINPFTGNKIAASTGTDGVITPDPQNVGYANFSSATIDFISLTPAVGGNKLVIYTDSNEENKGAFEIVGLDKSTPNGTLIIRKIILNTETMMNLFRSRLDGNNIIEQQDVNVLNEYVSKYYLDPILAKPFSVIRLVVELFDDRTDDYFSGNLSNRNAELHPIVDVFEDIVSLQNRNISTTYVTIEFDKQLTWEDYLVVSNTKNKLVPVIFDPINQDLPAECRIVNTFHNQYQDKPDFYPGKIDYFVPNNLIIGDGGELFRNNGDLYKQDFEVGTILLEIPTGMYGIERDINLLTDFIAEDQNSNTNGLTAIGFPAMKFADCTTVKSDALEKNQIRFSVSLQSFSPNTNGLGPNNINGVIVDGKVGVFIDPRTGVLRLNFTNLYQDEILQTLNTKVQVQVFLKKAGWNNPPLFVTSDKVLNLLKLSTGYLGTGAYPGDLGSPVANSLIVDGNPQSPLSGNLVPLVFDVQTNNDKIDFIISNLTSSKITLLDLNSPNGVEVILGETLISPLAVNDVSLKVGENLYNVIIGTGSNFSVYQILVVYTP